MTQTTCGKKFLFGPAVCGRTPGHLGLHRAGRAVPVSWGDNECAETGEQRRGRAQEILRLVIDSYLDNVTDDGQDPDSDVLADNLIGALERAGVTF